MVTSRHVAVTIEPWEEVFLVQCMGWKKTEIAELKLGVTELVTRAANVLLDKNLNAEELAVRDAFMMGWQSHENYIREKVRLEDQANAH